MILSDCMSLSAINYLYVGVCVPAGFYKPDYLFAHATICFFLTVYFCV